MNLNIKKIIECLVLVGCVRCAIPPGQVLFVWCFIPRSGKGSWCKSRCCNCWSTVVLFSLGRVFLMQTTAWISLHNRKVAVAPLGPLSSLPPPISTSYKAEMTHWWLQTTVSMADWQKWGSASLPTRPCTTQTDSQWSASEWRPVTHRKAIHHQAIYKWSSPTITFNGHEYEPAECTFAQQHTYMHRHTHTTHTLARA